ncbi:50S ribosomal protein L18e [Candidatus Woesearchaeota archaeon CG10_big_fil_rev_8_21_14_0_10_37_12]|nr:MAG: 50S ribosomal protein L18e [Candidatus Woesearchaeota archaeon CG10_big_fil_rev_8_21_14_0_10_37_12]
MSRTGPTNPVLRELIQNLRKESSTAKSGVWKRLADDLEKPTRRRRAVNISRIGRYSKPNEVIVVPGKVLGSGVLPHAVIVAALSFSEGAREQIENVKGKTLTIEELLSKKPKISELRIIG